MTPRKPQKPKPGHSLADLHPELIDEWSDKNELSPWEVSSGSNYKAEWVCEKGHKYITSCCYRTGPNKTGCKQCFEDKRGIICNRPLVGMSLADLHPDLVQEWSPRNKNTPYFYREHSGSIVWWLCPIHGEYQSQINSRVSQKSGCYKCGKISMGNTQSLPKFGNSLSEKCPKLSHRWSEKNSQKPEEVSYRSHRKAVFMCPDHGEYTSVIQSITSRISSNSFSLGCPICSYIQSGISNSTPNVGASFADLYPNLLKEYSDQNTKNPWSINPGTKYKATWICSKGHVWVTSVQHRTRSKSGCPLCFASNHTSLIETNLRTSLETLGFSQELRSKVEHWNVDLLNSDTKTVMGLTTTPSKELMHGTARSL